MRFGSAFPQTQQTGVELLMRMYPHLLQPTGKKHSVVERIRGAQRASSGSATAARMPNTKMPMNRPMTTLPAVSRVRWSR